VLGLRLAQALEGAWADGIVLVFAFHALPSPLDIASGSLLSQISLVQPVEGGIQNVGIHVRLQYICCLTASSFDMLIV
jgi:hypothetical protein